MPSPFKSRRMRSCLIYTPAVAAFAAAAYFILVTNQIYFHSDSATLQIWAEQVIQAKSLISPDFIYAEPRQIFNYHLFAIPWLCFMPASMTGHSIATLTFCTLFFACALYALREADMGPLARSVVVALVFSAPSPMLADMFWGELAYGWEALFTMLLVGFALRNRPKNATESKSLARLKAGILFLICAAFCLNGNRSLLIHFAPALCGLALVPFFDSRQDLRLHLARFGSRILVMALGGATGLLASKAITSGVTFGIDWITTASEFEVLKTILARIPLQYLNVFGALPDPGQNLNGTSGILKLCRACFAVLVFLTPIILTFRFDRLSNFTAKGLILTFWVTTAGILFVFVFSVANHPAWPDVGRYLIPICSISLILMGFLIDHLVEIGRRLTAAFVILVAMPTFVQSIGFLVNVPSIGRGENAHEQLASALAERGIRYGYATYWNASVITVRSGSAVRIRPVVFEDGIRQFPFHSAYSWYRGENFSGDTCLILTVDEESRLKAPGSPPNFKRVLDIARSRLELAGFIVYQYDRNLGYFIRPREPASSDLPFSDEFRPARIDLLQSEVEFSQAEYGFTIGDGWRGPEQWRKTGSRARFFMETPRSDAVRSLKIDGYVNTSDGPTTVQVSINGYSVHTQAFLESGEVSISASIPSEVYHAEFATIDLTTNPVWLPSEHGWPNDRRPLGISVARAKWE